MASCSMDAGSGALSTSAQMTTHAGSPLRKCWWRFVDFCSKLGGPLSQNNLRNDKIFDDSIKINVLVGVLSDLLRRQASQLPKLYYGVLKDECRVGEVSIGRKLFRMECE